MGDTLGWDHHFLGFLLHRFSRLRGLIGLGHCSGLRGVGVGWRSRENTVPMADEVPTRSQTILFGGLLLPIHIRSGRRAGCTVSLNAFNRLPLSQRLLATFQFTQPRQLAVDFLHSCSFKLLLLRGRALPSDVSFTTSNAPGYIKAVPDELPKRWQHLYCRGYFVARWSLPRFANCIVLSWKVVRHFRFAGYRHNKFQC